MENELTDYMCGMAISQAARQRDSERETQRERERETESAMFHISSVFSLQGQHREKIAKSAKPQIPPVLSALSQ